MQTEVKEVGVCLEMMFEVELMVKHQIIELPTEISSSHFPLIDIFSKLIWVVSWGVKTKMCIFSC